MNVTLRTKLFGLAVADFRPSVRSSLEQSQLIESTCQKHIESSLSAVCAMPCQFTNRIAKFNTDGLSFYQTSKDCADGGVVTKEREAIAIYSGDCPSICLHQGTHLAVLHAGYRCLIRANPAEDNVVDAAMQYFAGTEVKAWVGAGIGPCCWAPTYEGKEEICNSGLSHEAEILTECRSRTTDCSPFGPNKVSIDLYKLASALLQRAGVPESRINVDSRCTCCATERGNEKYWSHTRAKRWGTTNGRNCFLAWLDD